MRKLVVNQLYGLEVCLIVDEMTNSIGSYLNFLMACYSPTGGRDLSPTMGTFSWRTVSIQEYTAIVYAKEIAKVVKELEDEGMKVSSYASDNCSTMIATESLLHSLCVILKSLIIFFVYESNQLFTLINCLQSEYSN